MRLVVASLFLILGALFVPVCAAASVPHTEFISNVSSGNIPLNVQFIDSTTNTPTSWVWSFGDGGTSTSRNPVHVYSSAGTYTVTLTASNAEGSDTATKSGFITVSSAAVTPVALFHSNVTTGTVPTSVQFLDASTNSPTSWVWSFGDGSSSTEQNPVHAYTSAGTYTVTLTATNAGGSNTVSKTGHIVVGAVATAPDAAFLSTVESGSAPLTVQFVDSSVNTPTAWVWSFGDGNTSTLQNPSHTYTTEGTYTVTLTVTNTGGSDTMTKAGYISVTFAEPITSFTSNVTRGPAPLYVGFTDTSNNTPTSWKWKFGDDATSTDQNPTHKYTEPGKYTVSLTAKNSAGSNTTKMTDYITITSVGVPVASFTADIRSGTIPFTTQFADTSSNTPTSWLWSFGDGSSSTEKNPAHSYAAAGTYSVSLTATNEAGNNTNVASNYITANAVKTYTMGTTKPAEDETVTTPGITATVTAVPTAVPAASGNSSFPYVIAGIIIAVVIGAGAVLYFRSVSRGGHGRGGGEL
jgi:PKD repeat protein